MEYLSFAILVLRLLLRVAAAPPRLLAPPDSLLHSLIVSEFVVSGEGVRGGLYRRRVVYS